eukprot:scaffold8474_cov134-Isochrysis_galbana.AAC.6
MGLGSGISTTIGHFSPTRGHFASNLTGFSFRRMDIGFAKNLNPSAPGWRLMTLLSAKFSDMVGLSDEVAL